MLLGGPWGPQLRDEAFRRARAYVIDVFGELSEDHDGTGSASSPPSTACSPALPALPTVPPISFQTTR